MIALGVRSSLRRRGRSPQSIAQSDAEGEVVVIEVKVNRRARERKGEDPGTCVDVCRK